jgi:hypothetical protein
LSGKVEGEVEMKDGDESGAIRKRGTMQGKNIRGKNGAGKNEDKKTGEMQISWTKSKHTP